MDEKPPYTPVTPQNSPAQDPGNVIYTSSAPNGVVSGGAKKGFGKNKTLLAAGAAAIVVLGAAGYVFGFYLPNKPENVYKSALSNTGEGYQALIDYADNKEVAEKFKTSDATGSFKFDAGGFATDGTFKAKSDEKNATFSGDIGLAATRLKIEGVAKDAENSDYPDLYLKVGGIKGIGDSFGMPALDNLDSKWITLDHTLLDTYLSQAEAASGLENTGSMAAPKQEDVVDAAKVIGEVSNKYLFTADEKNGILKMDKYVAAEVVDGKDTYRYKVKADKDNLKAFAKELGEKLDKSKLNDWAKESYDKPLSELINTKDMIKSVDDIKDGDTFDMWVNKDTKLVHKIRFSEKSNPAANFMELGLNYDGGDEKPFFITLNSSEDDTETKAKLVLTLNTKTNVVKAQVDFEQESEGATNSGNVKFEVKPGTGKVDAKAPEGAVTLFEAMSLIGLGDYTSLLEESLSAESSAAEDAELAPFSITQ